MAKKMMAYILEQPQVWRRMVEDREILFQGFAEYLEKRYTRILIVGSGSSYIAAQLGADFYEGVLGIEAVSVVPTRIETWLKLRSPESTLVLAISQSGKSTSTIEAVSELRKKGFDVVSITSDAESVVAKEGSIHQLIVCGEETVGPKTKGMTGTVLTLYLMGLAMGRKWEILTRQKETGFLKDVYLAIEYSQENIEASIEFCKIHCEVLASQPHFLLISEDVGYYTVQEGALKVLETFYVPAMAYEFEEYMHGINNTIAPGICNIFVPIAAKYAQRMSTLEAYTRNHGCINFVVTTLKWEKRETTLLLKGSGNVYLSPFDVLLAFQVMSVYGSECKGIECDQPKFQDFYRVMNTKA